MGHGGPGTVPRHHGRLLQGRRGRSARLRHRQAPDLRERRALAAGAQRSRGPEHRDHAGREQVRSQASKGRYHGGGEDVCRAQRPLVHRDIGVGLDKRGYGLPEYTVR